MYGKIVIPGYIEDIQKRSNDEQKLSYIEMRGGTCKHNDKVGPGWLVFYKVLLVK